MRRKSRSWFRGKQKNKNLPSTTFCLRMSIPRTLARVLLMKVTILAAEYILMVRVRSRRFRWSAHSPASWTAARNHSRWARSNSTLHSPSRSIRFSRYSHWYQKNVSSRWSRWSRQWPLPSTKSLLVLSVCFLVACLFNRENNAWARDLRTPFLLSGSKLASTMQKIADVSLSRDCTATTRR